MIDLTAQAERVSLILHGIQKGPEKALYNAVNRGLSAVRTKSGKLIRETYFIKQSDLNANQRLTMKKATPSHIAGYIGFAGTVIPLKQFKVTPAEPKQQTVSVSVLRSEGAKRLEAAYVADLGLYGPGVFERLTSKRETSQQLFGPSPAHMAEHENVLEQTSAIAQEVVNKRLEHEISRILNGYGG